MKRKGMKNRLLSVLLMMAMVIGQISGMSFTAHAEESDPLDKSENPAIVENTATVIRGGNTLDLMNNITLNGATGDVSFAIDGEENNGCSLDGSVLTSGDTTGSVTVNVTVAEDDSFYELAETPITVTITDKNTQNITTENITVSYGDTDKSVSALTDGDGVISYAVKEGSEDYIDVDSSTGTLTIKAVPTDGKAYVTVTASETNTYEQAAIEVTVTIIDTNTDADTNTDSEDNQSSEETEQLSGKKGLRLTPNANGTTIVTNEVEFSTAILETGGLVQLGENINLEDADIYTFAQELTLDLNGHTLTLVSERGYFETEVPITIKDGIGGGAISVIGYSSSNSDFAFLIYGGGSLTLQSGTLNFTSNNTNGIDVYRGSFTMSGGTINSNGASIWRDGDDVTISGGTIKGEFTGVSGGLNITGGRFSFDPNALLSEEYTATPDGDYWVVGPKIEYDLWVNGVKVTNANMTDVLANDSINKGKVSFTPATDSTPATLTLKGATITSGHIYSQTHNVGILYSGDKPLDIVSEEGTVNTVNPNGTNPVGIFSTTFTGNLSFSGNGSITVTGDAHGIDCARNITIGAGTVIVSGTGNGIHSASGNVNITGGTVTVYGGNKAIDCNVKNSIAGTGWTDTEGITGRAAIDVNSDTGQDLSSYKKVMFPALVEYPLWVGNKQVTNENTSDILGNQTAYYDAASNTLTLNGATITTAYQPSDSNWKYGIYYNGTTALNIVLAAGSENSVDTTVNYGIFSNNNDNLGLSITGTGSFSAINTIDSGIYSDTNLKIEDGTVSVSSTGATEYGIFAGRNITIKDATVTAVANGADSYGIYTSFGGSTVTISGGSVVAVGRLRAVESILNNNIEGTGWDNTGGVGDGSPIPANIGYTLNYLKVRFPANHEHDGITFAAWTATDSLPVTAGNYYLENDVTLTETWNGLQGNINLCLNGKKISVKGGPNPSNDQGIYIPAGKTLSLYDCKGFGKIQPRDDYKGRCFDVVGTLNMYGGTICGFGDENLVRGAAVELWNAEGVTFNMYGGTISGNTSMSGPAVFGDSGSCFNMSGGTISGNSSIYDNTGAVEMFGIFTMTGGSITQNTKGGVAITMPGTLKVSGNPSVIGNNGQNVYLGTDSSSNQKKITISGNLGDDAKLGITMKNPGIFTSGLSTYEGGISCFTSDNNRYTVELDSGEAKITQSIYSVNFHLNYGTEDVIFETKDVNSGEYVTKPETDPVREKYHFKGWYKEPGCTSLFNFSKTAINANTELYAGWAPMITIHYDLGAGHEDLTKDVANAIEILLKDVSPTVKYTGHVVTIITPNYFPDQPFNSEPGLDPIGGLTPVTESGQTITVHFAQRMLEGITGQLLGDDSPLLLFVGQNPPGNYNSWEDIIAEQMSEDSDIVGEKTFYALWGTPIEQFDIECDPLICGTAVTYDDETELQSPEPVLTFDNAIVLGSKASWYGKDTDGNYSKLEFKVNGKNKYLLRSQFSSLFPKVFTEKTKVKLNGVEAKISPVSEDEPVMQPLGNILFLSGLIQADHDWEEVVLKEPTITEEGQKAFKCKHDTATQPGQAISRVTYSAVSGDGNDWTKGSKSTSNFRFVRSFQSAKYPETVCLDIVLVDGKPIDAVNYDTELGSVWVKLKPSYLETLSTGKHTIQATFTETYNATGVASYTTKAVTFTINPKSSGGGSTPTKKKDNVVTCQMAGYPANYAWNEAAKACQPGYIDAGGNFHPYGSVRRTTPNTSDNGNLTMYVIAMFLMTFVAYITAKRLVEDRQA